jgi:NADPH-dependent 2,4-dienoyl-CoA reductase/sulfur reductase-like enzyme
MSDRPEVDVTVIGGGPAGIAAAVAADAAGRSVRIVDEAAHLGGQIWRRDVSSSAPKRSRSWLRQLGSTPVRPMHGTTVIGARADQDRHLLTVERDGRAEEFDAGRLILATGARELFLPFPGWTLPGVLGVGAAQAMVKNGLDVRGKRVVVAGTGPLLVAVAASLARRGARIVLIAEQAPRKRMLWFGARLAAAPRIAFDAIGYLGALRPGVFRFGTWVTTAVGDVGVRQVIVANEVEQRTIECDLLCVGYGLVPNTELAHVLGCDVTPVGIPVNERQQTSIPGVYAAGECAGIAGVDAALAEGTIAGFAAAGAPVRGADLRARASARAWGSRLDATFALRPELMALARPDTIVCRCEDVRLCDIDRGWTGRQAKLYARVGMGPCQGRVCGPALARIYGWFPDRIRAPVHPSFMSSLAVSRSPRNNTGAT